MKFHNIVSSVVRKESFGGIVYIPALNVQVAVNEDLYKLIRLCKTEKTFPKILEKISRRYGTSFRKAKDILEECSAIFRNEIENYEGSHDVISDWGKVKQNPIRLSAPLMLIIEITRICNQGCKFCYQSEEKADDEELSQDLIFSIVDQAKKMKVFKIQYMGGEPLCREDFGDILLYTSRKGIYSSFTTNGVYLNKFIHDLKKVKKLLPVQISIHGGSKEHLHLYKISAREWNKTLNNCELLSSHSIPFDVKTVISRLNCHKIVESIRMFSELGARAVTLLHLLPVGGGKTMRNEANFTKGEVEDIVKQINYAKGKFKNIHIDYRPFLNIYFPKEPRTELDKLINCPAGNLDLRIRYDGKVLQCSSLRMPLNDMRKNNLKSVWSSILSKMLPCPYECNKVFHCVQNY